MSWDDGKHLKVKSVELTFDDVIRSIQVEYYGTNLQSQRRGTVGAKSDGFTLSPDEYIKEMTGYYKTTFSGDVITALTFTTNKKIYGTYGNKTRHFFSVNAPNGNQIAGFIGTSGNALNSIDVHFAPIPPAGSIKPYPDTKPGGQDGSKPGGPETNPDGQGSKPGGSETKPDGQGGSKPGGPETNPGGQGGSKPGGPETKPDGQGGSKPGGPETNPGGQGGSKPGGPETNPGGQGNKPGGSETNPSGQGDKPGGSETIPGGQDDKPGGHETNPGGPDKEGGSNGSGKMGPVGGNTGNTFDDGVFDGVKKLTIASDDNRVTYIKIEYEKDGKVETREHGTKRGEVKEFSVNYPSDYIIAVGGSYNHNYTYNTTLITSLYFTTSRGFTSPKFGQTDGTEFNLEGKNGGKLVGFHGLQGHAINAIGAHFQTSSDEGSKSDGSGKKEPVGGKKGETFDDGVFDGVKKLTIASDDDSVTYIKIDYVKDGKIETHEHGTNRGEVKEFLVNYPKENITAVGGTYDHNYTYNTTLITSLYFTTSNGFTSPLFGTMTETEFKLEGEKEEMLVGLYGRGGYAIDAIGAHFQKISKPSGKKEPVGGKKGATFDDGVFDGVKKLTIASDKFSVTYIKIDYVKDGRTETREHGTNRGEVKEFSVNYPKENITAVGGSYDHIYTYDTTLITSLYFTTSKGFTSPLFGKMTETEFKLTSNNGGKLLGFFGSCGTALDAIGAYFEPGIEKLEAQGGEGGNQWDDGADYDGVTKIYVAPGGYGIQNIRFDYVKNGEIKEGPLHGVKASAPISTFEISHPDEYLLSVEGWYDSTNIIQGIQFKTNTKTSIYFGYDPSEDGKQISLQVKDKKIIGFHGFADSHLHSLGAYLIPYNFSFKLPAKGGNGGVIWDDGVHDNIRKVYVSKSDSAITFVKFEYDKGSELLVGEGHGKTVLEVEEFVVDPDDYITSVKAFYENDNITALMFKTFKGITSQPFGKTLGEMFFIEGGKITGFHGRSSDVLQSIGAYMSLSSTPMLRGKWIQIEQKGKGPGPRCSHAISMVGDKMYSFGGEFTPNFHIDQHLYVFDFKTHTWSLAPPNGDVPDLPCLGVGMVTIGTTLYVFGGRDGHRNYNGFYSYDTIKSEWKLITHVTKGPAPRSFHSMAADDKNVYVFGGVSTTVRVNTLHAYNIVDQKWIEFPNPGESCQARGGAGLAVVQGKIWVVYGFNGDEMDDVHCFDLVEKKWSKVETKGEKPWPRSVFSMAVLGKYIIMYGGEIEMDSQAHLGPGKLAGSAYVLDTESLMWQKLDDCHSPRGWCASTFASIDGRKGLLIYGGKAPNNDRYEDIYFYGVDSA